MKELTEREIDEKIEAFLIRKSVIRSEPYYDVDVNVSWRTYTKDLFRPIKRLITQ